MIIVHQNFNKAMVAGTVLPTHHHHHVPCNGEARPQRTSMAPGPSLGLSRSTVAVTVACVVIIADTIQSVRCAATVALRRCSSTSDAPTLSHLRVARRFSALSATTAPCAPFVGGANSGGARATLAPPYVTRHAGWVTYWAGPAQ